MTDRYDQDQLLGYLEGDLTDAQRADFEQRMAEDEQLRRLVEQLRADRDALRDMPREAPPRDLLEDATQQLERQMLLGAPDDSELAESGPRRDSAAQTMRWSQALTYTGLAAAVLICAGVLFTALSDLTLWQRATEFGQLTQRQPNPQMPGANQPQPSTESAPGAKTESDAEAGDAPPDQLAQRETGPTESRTMEQLNRSKQGAERGAAPAGRAQAGDGEGAATDAARAKMFNQSEVEARQLARLLKEKNAQAQQRADAQMNRTRAQRAAVAATAAGAQRIEIVTRDARRTRRDLATWAARNAASIVAGPTFGYDDSASMLGALRDATRRAAATQPAAARESTAAPTTQPAAATQHASTRPGEETNRQRQSQQLVVRMRAAQVHDVVMHLNRGTDTTQRAAVQQASARKLSERQSPDEAVAHADGQRAATQPQRAATQPAAADVATNDRAESPTPTAGAMTPMRRAASDTAALRAATQPAEPPSTQPAAQPATQPATQPAAPPAETPFDPLALFESQLPLLPTTPAPDLRDEREADGQDRMVEIPVVIHERPEALGDPSAGQHLDQAPAPTTQPTSE